MVRQLEPTSLIDMRYMTNDSGFTSKYFYSQINKKLLPPPIKFGRSSRWLLSDYEQWKQKYHLDQSTPWCWLLPLVGWRPHHIPKPVASFYIGINRAPYLPMIRRSKLMAVMLQLCYS